MPVNFLSQLARKYRRAFPHLKFRIRIGKLNDAFATAHLRSSDGTFIITFPPGMDQSLKAFLLAHELAHAIAFHEDEEHGDAFWLAYRKTYAVYEEFVDEQNKVD